MSTQRQQLLAYLFLVALSAGLLAYTVYDSNRQDSLLCAQTADTRSLLLSVIEEALKIDDTDSDVLALRRAEFLGRARAQLGEDPCAKQGTPPFPGDLGPKDDE